MKHRVHMQEEIRLSPHGIAQCRSVTEGRPAQVITLFGFTYSGHIQAIIIQGSLYSPCFRGMPQQHFVRSGNHSLHFFYILS